MKRSLLRRVGGWLLPYSLFIRIEEYRDRRWREAQLEQETGVLRKLSAPNVVFKNIHSSERCFVLCNGPTVRQQNLLSLANEIVISVSNGYHHPDFKKFKPRYHCVPQVTYGILTEDDVVRWFTEMDQNLGDAEVFLSTTEEPLVKAHKLFSGRKVHYVFFFDSFDELFGRVVPDISNAIPGVQSVAVMALIIALYMGFQDIFLLGVEHDHFRTGVYNYFYEPTVLKGKDVTTAPDGSITTSNFETFHELGRLWRQYRIIREIASSNGANIWNATAGGELDEFPRVRLEDIFASSNDAGA